VRASSKSCQKLASFFVFYFAAAQAAKAANQIGEQRGPDFF
jgi:hypothetical protein